MGTITEDYVSFETAKILKEKGFYQDLFFDTTPVWKLNGNNPELVFNGDDGFPFQWEEWYSAPTLQMAMKWLREVHNVFIDISSRFSKNADKDVCFSYSCKKLIDTYKSSYEIGDGEWLNYEEACEAAIRCCLENLI